MKKLYISLTKEAGMNDLEYTSYRRLAYLLIIMGVLFGLDSYLSIHFVYKLWPLLILILGTGLTGIYIESNTRGVLYLSAGVYLICFSLLAFYCNFTSWAILARFWPLFITSLGVVFIVLYLMNRKKRFLLFIGFLLISLSIYFILVFSISGQYWWSIFIFLGLSLFLSVKNK